MDVNENIKKAAKAIQAADAILITAGAGIGVDSGLPDFRGNTGFWKAYPPIEKLGISFSQMANPQWFESNPRLAWAFYGHRLNLYRNTIPHKGFNQLLEIVENKSAGYFVFTSNVDGQFQKAGYSEDLIEECHGSINYFQCVNNCSHHIWDADGIDVEVDEEAFEALDPLPTCIQCGGLARPNILMFGDWSWISSRSDHQSQNLSNWLQDIRNQDMNLVVIEMGAGEAVPTVRMCSERVGGLSGSTMIRINPRDYHTPAGHISIPLGSAEGIDKICKNL